MALPVTHCIPLGKRALSALHCPICKDWKDLVQWQRSLIQRLSEFTVVWLRLSLSCRLNQHSMWLRRWLLREDKPEKNSRAQRRVHLVLHVRAAPWAGGPESQTACHWVSETIPCKTRSSEQVHKENHVLWYPAQMRKSPSRPQRKAVILSILLPQSQCYSFHVQVFVGKEEPGILDLMGSGRKATQFTNSLSCGHRLTRSCQLHQGLHLCHVAYRQARSLG